MLVHNRELNGVDPHVIARIGPVVSRAGATETGRQLSLSAAMQLFEQGDFEGSAEALRAAIVAEPSAVELRVVYARLLGAQAQFEDARVVLEAVVEATPDDADAWANLAEILRSLGRFDDALAACSRSGPVGKRRYVDPGHVWPGALSARQECRGTGRTERGGNARRAGLGAHDAVPSCFWALEQPDDAIGTYTAAAAASPDAILPLIERGRVEYDLDRYEAVLVTCEEAAARDPSHLDMLGLRAVALFMTQRYLEALGTLDRAVVIDASPPRLYERARGPLPARPARRCTRRSRAARPKSNHQTRTRSR